MPIANERTNRRLVALLEAEQVDNPQTQVNADWACFQETLERTVRQEIGSEFWGNSLRAAADEAGYVKVDQAKKNPVVLLDAYQRIRQEDGSSMTLAATVGAIRAKLSV